MLALGRCIACYRYWKRHQLERPGEFEQQTSPPARRPAVCVNCGAADARRNDRCNTCSTFLRRNGHDRPWGLVVEGARRDDELRHEVEVCSA